MQKVVIYTDGACSGNQSENNFGGWGVVVKHDSRTTEFFGGAINTTNNKMELQATIEGLKVLINTNVEVEMYLDSNYVLQGITSWITNWKKNGWKTASKKPVENKELWIELDELKSKFSNIEFIKVKGHAGVELNELADQLANKGVDSVRNNTALTTQNEQKDDKIMEFGDKEWFEAVEENSSFPSDFAFYVTTDRKISSSCMNNSVKSIGNLKYRDLIQWSDAALVEVVNCKTSLDYYNTVKSLRETWS